ncbi:MULTISPECIES: thiol-disulfide oxidoreductase ResA [Cytobacillus]|uniref:Thiol-disulfide oxidoreductase ResA n=1 Tax=Cytobacillus stercorigallinarum TaxID=2762240 RepID=A0ABR8QKH0_9BACI|nr:thiol-disulfide oxidoreductase ResA [Cytobacillus stercorigallinarum]MBD7936020.1 thiol-disulfide oxidoreductase ResA [Cytobacillus stercorigallinarum]
MKKRRLVMRTAILVILFAAVAYTLYANFNKENVHKVQIGKEAPDFVLVDMDGKEHQLSDYKGQGVFLNFWGTWCKPCEKEMPFINNQYEQFKNQGVQTIAVNISESNLAVNKFIERHGMTFPVVIDKNEDVKAAYGIGPLPATFLINPEGEVVKYHTGTLTEPMVKDFMTQIKP